MVASAISNGMSCGGCLQLSGGYTADFLDIGSGDPIVVVPGIAGGVALLEPLIAHLSQTHRVVACQLRGDGHGIFERRFRFDQFADDLEEFIGALRLERPALIGVSFGGAIALQFASRRSTPLSYMAVQGASPRYRPSLFSEVARRVLDRLPIPADSPFINQFFSVLLGERRRAGDCFDFVVDRWWQTDQSVMAHRFALLDEFDLEPRLNAVRVPLLVMRGENDVLVSTPEANRLADQVPRGSFQGIPGAGHLAFVTHPAAIVASINRFAAQFNN